MQKTDIQGQSRHDLNCSLHFFPLPGGGLGGIEGLGGEKGLSKFPSGIIGGASGGAVGGFSAPEGKGREEMRGECLRGTGT